VKNYQKNSSIVYTIMVLPLYYVLRQISSNLIRILDNRSLNATIEPVKGIGMKERQKASINELSKKSF